jgi:hypothetical protein
MVASTAASVAPATYIFPERVVDPDDPISDATGENWTDRVHVDPGAIILPVQASDPLTTEKLGSENAVAGESAVVVDVNGKTLGSPMKIGIAELFVRVTRTGEEVPPGEVGLKLREDGLTPILPGLVGVVPGATNINVP